MAKKRIPDPAYLRFLGLALRPVDVSSGPEGAHAQMARIEAAMRPGGGGVSELQDVDLLLLLQHMLIHRGIGTVTPEGSIVAHLRARAAARKEDQHG